MTSHRRIPAPGALFAAAWLAGLAPAALAAPPLTQQDASTLERGNCQLETERRQFHERAELDVVAACNLVLDAEIAVGKLTVAPRGEKRVDSVVYQFKKVLIPVEESSWGAGFNAATIRETNRRPAARQHSLTGMLTREFGDTRLHLNFGIVREPEAEEGTRGARASWGMAVEHDSGERWTAVAEVFGQQGSLESTQVGFRWWLMPKHVQLTGSVGAQRGEGRDGRWVSFGVRFETGGSIF